MIGRGREFSNYYGNPQETNSVVPSQTEPGTVNFANHFRMFLNERPAR